MPEPRQICSKSVCSRLDARKARTLCPSSHVSPNKRIPPSAKAVKRKGQLFRVPQPASLPQKVPHEPHFHAQEYQPAFHSPIKVWLYPCGLGTTHPNPSNVRMELFPALPYKVLVWLSATNTKVCNSAFTHGRAYAFIRLPRSFPHLRKKHFPRRCDIGCSL